MEKSKSLFSKQWFIKSNTTDIKIENVYKFDVDKVFNEYKKYSSI